MKDFMERKKNINQVYGLMEDMFFDETTCAKHSTRVIDTEWTAEDDLPNSVKKKSERLIRKRPIDVYLNVQGQFKKQVVNLYRRQSREVKAQIEAVQAGIKPNDHYHEKFDEKLNIFVRNAIRAKAKTQKLNYHALFDKKVNK